MKSKYIIGLLIILLGASCTVTKKAQRKARRADKLLKEVQILAPQIIDTMFTKEIEYITITKDSLVTEIQIQVDTSKVDSLLTEYNELKNKGADTKYITKKIIEEVIPEINQDFVDSVSVMVDEKETFIRFKTNIELTEAGDLVVTTKALDDLQYVKTINTIEIDAVRKSFFQDWKFWLILAAVIAFFVFKEALMTWIKGIL